ncbi:hypothetical protein AYO44_07570 [Planctomycetaceae bacterium SCGC AG-212-F19]|nr:hypothetical protein AYO44_07570 [Planctomycetaceae bacterium SCGC AG-212-F19]
MARDHFIYQLGRQLRFLETSCRDYDAGNWEEAIRIATTLRVIFHHTNNSTSLLSHLGETTINLLSTCGQRASTYQDGFWPGFLQARICIEPPSTEFHPNLGTRPGCHKQVLLSYWWHTEMVFFCAGRKFKRKQLVLDAANKDGGSHVDAALPANYKWLLDGEYFKFSAKPANAPETEYPIRFGHVAALRQIAYEVLHSTDLLKLTQSGVHQCR